MRVKQYWQVKMLAQGSINKNLILLPKELFQCELIDVLKNTYKCFNNDYEKVVKKVMQFSFENCMGTLFIICVDCAGIVRKWLCIVLQIISFELMVEKTAI